MNIQPKIKKKKTIASMTHAVVKKTNKAIGLSAKSKGQHTSSTTGSDGYLNLGQGGVATSAFLNQQQNNRRGVNSYQGGDNRFSAFEDGIHDSTNVHSNLIDGVGRFGDEELHINPYDEVAVGNLACQVLSQLSVDPRSIGGTAKHDKDAPSSNLLLQGINPSTPSVVNWKTKDRNKDGATKKLANECLVSMRVGKFNVESSSGSNIRGFKARNKLRYICIIRSTNRPLMIPSNQNENGQGENNGEPSDSMDDEDDGYDTMYSPEYANSGSKTDANKSKQNAARKNKADAERIKLANVVPCTDADADEVSSFPYLLCLAIHGDGSHPDVRKVIDLSQLVSITVTRKSSAVNNTQTASSQENNDSKAGNLRLRFRNGEFIEINCHHKSETHGPENNSSQLDTEQQVLRREKLLWSILQIHSILCASVVERYVTEFAKSQSLLLPAVSSPGIDKAELQYQSTVNGFLSDSPVLCALLERQRNHRLRDAADAGTRGVDMSLKQDLNDGKSSDNFDSSNKGENDPIDDTMDIMAYDMMMGNYSKINLFQNSEEEKDAADILNNTPWLPNSSSSNDVRGSLPKTPLKENLSNSNNFTKQEVDASNVAESLTLLLQKRMRDLEAETCRRLIAWEDEKHISGNMITLENGMNKQLQEKMSTSESVDAFSLVSLLTTLDELESELKHMEAWLEDRAAVIKPLTDDCREIEEENRRLEQQHQSFGVLGSELNRLLNGLQVPDHLQRVLKDPVSVLPFVQSLTHGKEHSDALDEKNEEGVDLIYEAGEALKDVLDRANKEGGVHLRAISEQMEVLIETKESFCDALSMIIVRIMETLANDIVERLGPLSKDDTHTAMVKKIKDTQRKFHTSFLAYKKLLEIVSLLRPELMDPIRAGYASLVAEGILSKKRMKTYFHSLPMKSCTGIVSVSHDLKEYNNASFKPSGGMIHMGDFSMKSVDSKDMKLVLSEMLPVIAREAYFTAAMFGMSGRHLDGRSKKRNFETARQSVDHSTTWFRYYIMRVLGIATDTVTGQSMSGDPLLSLVASIHLSETMENYVDKQKKGGDHSLSLAYVRATIMDLKKKVEKQWVSWVEEEIIWIRSNFGVPLNGKRAGVFASFSKFPSYLDHVIVCVRAGRDSSQQYNLTRTKVISHYLQKMAGALFASLEECSTRETADQQYAASVMRMENTYFFSQCIKHRGSELNALFASQTTAANSLCKRSMDSYLGWMIKREFKHLHSLFSKISSIRKDVGDADVPIHVPRATFIKTLQKESNKEIMKEKIAIIYARMEKHLSEESRLLPVAWKALVKVLYEWFGRWEKLSTQCYHYVLSPSAVDMVRIAKEAGGSGMRKPRIPDDVEKH